MEIQSIRSLLFFTAQLTKLPDLSNMQQNVGGVMKIQKLLIVAGILSQVVLMAAVDVSLQTNSDGSKTVKEPDGTTMQYNQDGSKITTEPNGTVTKMLPDGSKHVQQPNGTTVDIKPGAKAL